MNFAHCNIFRIKFLEILCIWYSLLLVLLDFFFIDRSVIRAYSHCNAFKNQDPQSFRGWKSALNAQLHFRIRSFIESNIVARSSPANRFVARDAATCAYKVTWCPSSRLYAYISDQPFIPLLPTSFFCFFPCAFLSFFLVYFYWSVLRMVHAVTSGGLIRIFTGLPETRRNQH